MVRIAIITTMVGSPWGGSEYLWASTAEQALGAGHEVIISLFEWSVQHPIVQYLQQQGAILLPRVLPKHNFTSKVQQKFWSFFPENSHFKRKSPFQPVFDCKPDIICVNQGSVYEAMAYSNFVTQLLQSSIPYFLIGHVNGDRFNPDSQTQKIAKSLFAKAARVGFVSYQNWKLAERQLAQTIPNAVVIQNPVNMSDRSLLPYPFQSTPNFAVVARLDRSFKGQDILFEALSSPSWQERDWYCNLYGSGPDQDYLDALAHHYGIRDRIHFKGHLTDIRAIWADNHLLILPSRDEGTPLALIEAMFCGRPAIVTDVGGNTEWIQEPNTGFIAEAPTAKSLASALERAWSAQADWKQMGMQAYQYVTKNIDPEPGKRFLELILESSRE